MPELPEVETTRSGIAPHIIGQTVSRVVIRQPQLRWPVSPELAPALKGQPVRSVTRRGKYLLIHASKGVAILHLGMSGSLRIATASDAVRKHDHVDIVFANNRCLRFHDPRRFGALLWTSEPLAQHPLLSHLGPEPLGNEFSAAYLYALSRRRRVPVKAFIMDARVVVGVGNIYANEALFMAGINPLRPAGRIGLIRYQRLVNAIRDVLAQAIAQGGTTLRDFVGSQGEPGYFRQYLRVYERAGQPCRQCGRPIRLQRLAQRATYDCPRCQR